MNQLRCKFCKQHDSDKGESIQTNAGLLRFVFSFSVVVIITLMMMSSVVVLVVGTVCAAFLPALTLLSITHIPCLPPVIRGGKKEFILFSTVRVK